VLAVLLLYRLVRRPQALAAYLSLAAILLATGHALPLRRRAGRHPGRVSVGVLLWRNRGEWRRILAATAIAAAVGGALLGAFYVALHLQPALCRHLLPT
jgi:anti-sigma-K factor RskA